MEGRRGREDGERKRVAHCMEGDGEVGKNRGGWEGEEGEHALVRVCVSPSDKWRTGGRKSECARMMDEEKVIVRTSRRQKSRKQKATDKDKKAKQKQQLSI